MPKYTVHAQITIYKELEIEASCRGEAIADVDFVSGLYPEDAVCVAWYNK